MHDNTRGGNDTLIGGDGGPTMRGDADAMFDDAIGGNDLLVSAPGPITVGDAAFINGIAASPTAPTGNVKTGADTFIFAPGNGNADINDFRQTDGDKIDVSAYGFSSLVDMMITSTGSDTKIAFDAIDSVTLVGISDPSVLHASTYTCLITCKLRAARDALGIVNRSHTVAAHLFDPVGRFPLVGKCEAKKPRECGSGEVPALESC